MGVSSQPSDPEHLEAMLERTIANTGARPTTSIADASHWSEENANICAAAQTDAHIATSRQKHGQRPPAPRGRIPSSLDIKGRMTRKLRTKAGRAVYAKRKTIVEPVCALNATASTASQWKSEDCVASFCVVWNR